MGRATIVSGGTDGRYTISLDYGSSVRNARVAKLTAKIAELEARAVWQQELLDGFTGGLESIENEFNALVSEFVALSNAVPRDQAAMDAKRKQIDEKTKELLKQQEWTASAQADLGMTKSAIKATTLERGALLTAEVTETRQAWCADLTDGATGAVATLEVPGESALILIQPGAPAPTAIHGALVAREVQSPGQVFWNAAVLPGWQKFKPTYRWGTITSLDQNADTCSVSLADAKSSAQQLGVNQSDTLTAVPIRYMECNSAVFAVGDRVIVEFTGNAWTAPVVIGFVDNPKACSGGGLYCIPADDTAPFGWSPPVTDGAGAPINGGKGSIALYGDGSAPAGVLNDGTNRTAGVSAAVARGVADGLASRTRRGIRADVLGIPSSGPTKYGNDDEPSSFSSIGRMAYEWISKSGQYICTAFDTCRVNGRDVGKPSPGTPYKVFIPNAALTGGTPTVFCIAEQFGDQMHLYRRPLAGDASVAWEWVSTIVISAVDTTPSLSISSLRKIITNDSASILTMWFGSGSEGYGCVDIAIPGGSSTWTPAEKSFSKNYDTTDFDDPTNPKVDTFTTQISVDYVGNSKAFATVTGTRTYSRVNVEGPPVVPDHSDPTYYEFTASVHEVITANFWGQEVTIADFLLEGVNSGTNESDDGVTISRTTHHEEVFATLDSRAIYFFHGSDDPIIYSFKRYGRSQIISDDDEYIASTSTDTTTGYMEIPEMQYGTAFLHAGTEHDLTEWTRPAYRYSYSGGVETYPPETGGDNGTFFSTYQAGEWATDVWDAPGGYWTPGTPGLGYGTMSDVQRHFACFFVPASATRHNTGSGYHSPVTNFKNGLNLRAFNGFAIFSHPTTAEGDEGFRDTYPSRPIWPVTTFPYPADSSITMDTSAWHTYCSESLSRYALTLSVYPPVSGRLKYIQLGSA